VEDGQSSSQLLQDQQSATAVTSASDEKTVNSSNSFIDIPAIITSMDIDNIATFDQHVVNGAATMKPPPPSLGTIMKMLPASTFDVSTPTSLLYFILDVSAVLLCMTALTTVIHTDIYHNLPLVGQALTVLPIQLVTGFAMWCTWCIGHDAGHGTVSKDIPILNRIVGEICHSVICLTPYVPWQLSHLKHHLNHNHLTKDYSHQWYIKEKQEEQHIAIQLAYTTRMIFLPFLYFVYLVLGIPDGGHVYFYGRMWEGTTMKEKVNASLSVITSLVTSGILWHSMGTTDFTIVCMVPWLVMSFWLFMVTYLQHHSEDGKLYTDETFTFTHGAFETVDRDYGKYINRLSHHMMDGHVVHHLFFTKVPHYRLEVATEALQVGLHKLGQDGLYKRIDTPHYTQEIIKQFHNNWFFIKEENVVRE
jgi:omega-3 fatty acid desaturase (delta-15 desaturase)